MSNDLTISSLQDFEGEPRVEDLSLAKSLNMTDPHSIRRIIERNRTELEGYGRVSDAASETSPAGGRPGRVFYLNEAQALLVCMFARTTKAAEVRRQVIAVFTAYRAGRLAPRSELAELEARIARLEADRHRSAGSDIEHAVALADMIERFDYGRRGDGIHLGPSDLRVCVVHLRGGASPRALPSRPDPTRVVREAIERAGRDGIARGVLLKRYRLFASELDDALRPLLAGHTIAAKRSVGPRGGRPGITYRAWVRDD